MSAVQSAYSKTRVDAESEIFAERNFTAICLSRESQVRVVAILYLRTVSKGTL